VFQLHERAVQFARELNGAGFSIINNVVFNQVLVSPSEEDHVTQKLLETIQASGECWVGGSIWKGKKVIRISVCSWATSEQDISRSVQAFIEARSAISEK
jgi:threonine aldolase